MKIKTILRRCWILLVFAIIAFALFVSIRKQTKNPTIITTIFPAYDIARNILKDTDIDLKMLIAPGNGIHDYDPTPQDIIDIQNAEIIIYIGGESDAWLDDIIETANKESSSIRLMDYINPIAHDADEYDEHIWLSPKNNISIIEKLSIDLSTHFDAFRDQISQNADIYKKQFQKLDQKFANLSSKRNILPLIVADHFPFAYLTRDYNLSYDAAYTGCSHEAEPSSAKISELIEIINNHNIPTIFVTEFSNQKIANTITKATDANITLLYSAETISAENFAKNTSLYDLLSQNYNTIRGYYDATN